MIRKKRHERDSNPRSSGYEPDEMTIFSIPLCTGTYTQGRDLPAFHPLGLSGRNRTYGPSVPNRVLYQAELLSGKGPKRARYNHRLGPQASKRAEIAALRVFEYGPGAFRPKLGRSQAVRHRVLIPACGGSNPPEGAAFSSCIRRAA